MNDAIQYTPPPTVRSFILDYKPGELFYNWIVGPLGSGKTTGLFFKLIYMAKLQARSPDGIRHSRAVIVRSTVPQLKDTTIKSWEGWFKDGQAGKWEKTERNFTLRFDDVECEVLFRPLDTAEDISRVLSLEVTFAIIDEFVDIPRAIIDALSGRLGRYPAKKDGGATNWGMWGSSNPSTEDNWWYEYLHDKDVVDLVRLYGDPVQVAATRARMKVRDARNVRYFVQPPGNGPYAENTENLPGGISYYLNQAIGKSLAWIKQFIEAEWGFSASETPVIKSFAPAIHIAKTKQLLFNPQLPLIGGLDPGLSGTAVIFGQEDLYGRLLVLGEVGIVGVGITRFMADKLKPYLRRNFPNAQVILAPDPASANRGQIDEVSVVETLKKHFAVSIETNNHLAKRIDAIESFTTRLTDMGPALLIDREMCPTTVRALSGGWRFGLVPKGDTQKPSPDKNSYSHYGDAFGYLCRYFHKQYERNGVRGRTLAEQRQAARPAPTRSSYHVR